MFLVALACLSATLALNYRQKAIAPGIVMLPVAKLPTQKVPLPDRWMPTGSSWGWLWHLKEFILGRAKVINLSTTIVDFAASTERDLSNLALGPPDFVNTNGLRIWQFDAVAMDAFRRRLAKMPGGEVLAKPGFTTADGVEGIMKTTMKTEELVVDYSTRLIRSSVDLAALITLSEAMTNAPFLKTNFALAARMQITNGGGVFLLDPPSQFAQRERIGVFISANLPKPEK